MTPIIWPLANSLAAKQISPLSRSIEPGNQRQVDQGASIAAQSRAAYKWIRSWVRKGADRAEMSLTIVMTHANHNHAFVIASVLFVLCWQW
jgi:hypothetical protein